MTYWISVAGPSRQVGHRREVEGHRHDERAGKAARPPGQLESQVTRRIGVVEGGVDVGAHGEELDLAGEDAMECPAGSGRDRFGPGQDPRQDGRVVEQPPDVVRRAVDDRSIAKELTHSE
jgi:hypothetical protein